MVIRGGDAAEGFDRWSSLFAVSFLWGRSGDMAARKKSGGEELVIGRSHAGGRNGAHQKRRAPKGGYTKKQKALFLEVLAETSNVSEACRAIGKHPGAISYLQRRDAASADGMMKGCEES